MVFFMQQWPLYWSWRQWNARQSFSGAGSFCLFKLVFFTYFLYIVPWDNGYATNPTTVQVLIFWNLNWKRWQPFKFWFLKDGSVSVDSSNWTMVSNRLHKDKPMRLKTPDKFTYQKQEKESLRWDNNIFLFQHWFSFITSSVCCTSSNTIQ